MKKLIPMAICYDFDGTLAFGNMQEHGFVNKLQILHIPIQSYYKDVDRNVPILLL